MKVAYVSAFASVCAVALGMVVGELLWGLSHAGAPTPIVEHFIHAVLLAGPITVAVVLTLEATLVRPLRAIARKLYRVGVGHYEPMDTHPPVAELIELERGINTALTRLQRHEVEVRVG